MIMRKFHNSLAVGFFMGCVIATSQLFFSLFLVFIGYGKDQDVAGSSSHEEHLMAILALFQSILLGSFAAILAAHRSEILDKNNHHHHSTSAAATSSSQYSAPEISVTDA
jgi:hypothetical protein